MSLDGEGDTGQSPGPGAFWEQEEELASQVVGQMDCRTAVKSQSPS